MASVAESAQSAVPRVFISYSHDSPAHEANVLALANRLREKHGIDAVLDRYPVAPPEGWLRWMDAQIEQARFVLAICSENYKRRAEGKEKPGAGLGANHEGLVISHEIYEANGRNERFIAVLLRRDDERFIPKFLKPYQHESVESENQFKKLLRRLTHQPEVVIPPLGPLPSLPPIDLQSTPITASQPNALWTIPPRNPFFSGREEYLKKLHQALNNNGGTAALTQAIQGLGGIGKTQTAIEYAHLHRAEYRAAFFLVADSPSAIISGYASLARRLDLPEKDEQEIEKAARAAKHWFDSNTGWLLILDNVDEIADVKNWVPDVSQGRGHVIITTRIKATGLLALDQAGAYIEEASLSVAEYLEMYRREGKKLRARTYETADHASVRVTFALAFAKLSEPAKELVRMCAFLASEAIPEEILTRDKEEDLAFRESVTNAAKYSLIARNASNKTINIHRLVQDVIKDEMDPDAQRQQAERVVNAMNAVFPNGSFETWQQCERLLEQARVAAQWITDFGTKSISASLLLNKATTFLHGRGQYDEVRPLLQRELDIDEKTLGAENPKTIAALNNLAALYLNQGHYAESKPLYLRALPASEKINGVNHPYTITTLNNLAELCLHEGDYAEAERLNLQALAARTAIRGEHHPETLQSLNNLASVYNKQGRLDEAERLQLRVLAGREDALGAENPDTLTSMNNLASVYAAQRRYPEAEELYLRVLPRTEKILGVGHPQTLRVLNNLAGLYYTQGHYAKADALCTRALEGFEKTLGPIHPHTLSFANNYASLLRKLGREYEARALEARFRKKK